MLEWVPNLKASLFTRKTRRPTSLPKGGFSQIMPIAKMAMLNSEQGDICSDIFKRIQTRI